MKLTSEQIFKEYKDALIFKESLGSRGMYEQNRINERFFIGDQWHGAKCGNERPLVRHNIIKRIGDYKMSHILGSPVNVVFSADGITSTTAMRKGISSQKKEFALGKKEKFEGEALNDEINVVMSTLGDYHKVTAQRTGFERLCERALRNAYITGNAVIYTYWNSEILTGLCGGKEKNIPIKGDIECELLDIENVFFGDPYEENMENQPYIIIRSEVSAQDVKREALKFGCTTETIDLIDEKSIQGKITLLTRLYKEYNSFGNYTIKCIKSIEGAIIRPEFDTGLHRYPLALFTWEKSKGNIYGQSEVTYLIPNQIAINRMITANVWAKMTAGMPIMVVNGDTVTDKITNEPGQIIKVYGTNEDVAGSIKYITPASVSESFDTSINTLIENTLTQSGANEVALGDSKADNAAALTTMRNAAIMPIGLIKNRFYGFIEEISRIWVDFWLTYYGNRKIRVSDENGVWYMPFNAERYKDLIINAKVYTTSGAPYSDNEVLNALNLLYDKGIITKEQFVKRMPSGIISDTDGLLTEINDVKETENDRT